MVGTGQALSKDLFQEIGQLLLDSITFLTQEAPIGTRSCGIPIRSWITDFLLISFTRASFSLVKIVVVNRYFSQRSNFDL